MLPSTYEFINNVCTIAIFNYGTYKLVKTKFGNFELMLINGKKGVKQQVSKLEDINFKCFQNLYDVFNAIPDYYWVNI